MQVRVNLNTADAVPDRFIDWLLERLIDEFIQQLHSWTETLLADAIVSIDLHIQHGVCVGKGCGRSGILL